MSGIMQMMAASKPATAQSMISSGLTYYINIGNTASYPGTGITAADLAGSGAGNTSVAASYVSAGQASYLTTDGATQWLLAPNLISKFNSPSNKTYTLEVWVKTSADNGVIVTEQGTMPANTGWHAAQMEIVAGNLRVGHWNNGIVNLLVGAVTRNVWQQYVSTYDGTTLKGYINAGTPTSVVTGRTAPWEYGMAGLWYGLMVTDTTSLGDGTWLAGSFAQFKLYNRALTAAEVLQNFNATKTTYGL